MTAGMNDAIHVQIEIVKLHVIRIGFGRVNWGLDAIHHLRLLLHAMNDDGREFPAQPPEKGRNSHGGAGDGGRELRGGFQ